MSPLVLLFDIDGTLIDSGGAGRRAMLGAFETLAAGRDEARSGLNRIAFAGMTDRAIARAGLEAVGQPVTSEAIEEVLRTYLENLQQEIERTPSYIIHAGILDALEYAAGRAGCGLGLGTGNLRAGARLKLGKGGIFDRFSFGGFGCDHENRAEILRIGAQRGAEIVGAPLSSCRVVVIGDTPKDIAAATAIGAECLAVATGQFTEAELRQHRPKYVFPDLTSPRALEVLFGS